jgi:hypothetical protein
MPGFDADATRRIARAVRKGELTKARVMGPRADAPRLSAFGRWFRTTTSITAATDSGTVLTLGSGSAKPLRPDPADATKRIDAGYAAMTIRNGLNGDPIAAGKVVFCLPENGEWVVNLVWCT